MGCVAPRMSEPSFMRGSTCTSSSGAFIREVRLLPLEWIYFFGLLKSWTSYRGRCCRHKN